MNGSPLARALYNQTRGGERRMSLQIVIDMNLSPGWAPFLTRHGWPAVHWSAIGDPRAKDVEIMAWSIANQHVVFTHDLDFGTLLALTHSVGPSVLQIRTDNVLPDHLGAIVLATLRQHEPDLLADALIVVDESRSRVRVLPCKQCFDLRHGKNRSRSPGWGKRQASVLPNQRYRWLATKRYAALRSGRGTSHKP